MPLPHWIREQLSGPSGVLARPMAHLLNRSNQSDYLRALEALEAQPGETVLELGFGGGVGVDALLAAGIKVIAAEPAESMRARAYRRWAWPLAQGRLEIWPQGAETLPDQQVARAISMNTLYFWQDIDQGFARLGKLVDTRVILGIAPVAHLKNVGFEREGYRIEEPSWYRERLAAAGFTCSIVPSTGHHSCSLLVGDKPSIDQN